MYSLLIYDLKIKLLYKRFIEFFYYILYPSYSKCKKIMENSQTVTVQPAASLLRNPAHLKFAVRKGLDSPAEFTHSHGLCSKCKVLG